MMPILNNQKHQQHQQDLLLLLGESQDLPAQLKDGVPRVRNISQKEHVVHGTAGKAAYQHS
jgi:hypothetical protein